MQENRSPIIKTCLITAGVILILAAAAFLFHSFRARPISGIEDGKDEGSGKYSFTYEGTSHSFIADLPEKTKGAPLVILLHGQGNTAESFKNTIHFEKDALPRGYAVVYVTAAADPDNPSYGIEWNSGIHDGKNDDVGMLVALSRYLTDTYSFDKDRIYAAGFSNGAFMIHRLAMEAGDTFAAVASVAGFMPQSVWDERNQKNHISLLQITGEKDDVVPKNSDGSAKRGNAPAIEDVMDYWAASNGLEKASSETLGKKDSVLTKFEGPGKSPSVWYLFVKDGRHSWPDEKTHGIDANNLILDFFEK